MRTHQLVLAWIEDQLSAGRLAVGGRLPAERTLAEQLKVSRTSVREAIRILEAMGVVRAGVGSGPESGTVVISDPTSALGSALRLHVATQHLPVADIVETRILLESWAAGDWCHWLRRALELPIPTEKIPMNGAAESAQILLEMLT